MNNFVPEEMDEELTCERCGEVYPDDELQECGDGCYRCHECKMEWGQSLPHPIWNP